MKVLFITTSHDKLGETGRQTGVWLEELADPYYIFREAGGQITLASPGGGEVPLDPKSQSIILATRHTKIFLKDEEAMNLLTHSTLLQEVKADDFDMVFLPGGHGSMWDIAGNKMVTRLLEDFYSSGKPVAAVSHGVAGLLALQNDNEEFLLKGKQVTGFSNSEEEAAGLAAVVPFLLETELLSIGAFFSKAADAVKHVVVDGNIITGQNPASSGETARKALACFRQHEQKQIKQPALD